MASGLCLQVNGVDISKARVRNRLEDGSPYGAPEVVIDVPATVNLPALGEITLEGNEGMAAGLPEFVVRVREDGSKDWRTVSPRELASLLART